MAATYGAGSVSDRFSIYLKIACQNEKFAFSSNFHGIVYDYTLGLYWSKIKFTVFIAHFVISRLPK